MMRLTYFCTLTFTVSHTTLIIKIKSHFFFSWKRSGEAYNEPVLLSDMSDSLRSEVRYVERWANYIAKKDLHTHRLAGKKYTPLRMQASVYVCC